MIILPIVCIKNTVGNLDCIFPKTSDQSYLVKIVLIMHNKCSQADITHNSVNCSHAEQIFFNRVNFINDNEIL